MDSTLAALIEKMRQVESEIDAELTRRSAEMRAGLEKQGAVLAAEVLLRQRELKIKLSTYVLKAPPLVILTSPFIYALIIPFVLLDLFVAVYQFICFPVYGIPKVVRGDYFVFDRERLAYLNALEMLNCAYCSYGNGVIAYVREVASRTEQYWCPIKHAQRLIGAHARYAAFADYGDAEGFRKSVMTFPDGGAKKRSDGA